MALLLRREIAPDLLELLHAHLHAREPPLERADLLLQLPALLVERGDVFGHRLELLEPRLEVRSVGAHRLELVVEQVEHLAVMVAERPLAGGAIALVAQRDELVALVPQLRVLGAQRVASRLRLLPVAHPLRAAQLQLALRRFVPASRHLELDRDLFLERGRGLRLRELLAQLVELGGEHALLVEPRLASPVVHLELAHPGEFVADLVERREFRRQRHQRLAGRRPPAAVPPSGARRCAGAPAARSGVTRRSPSSCCDSSRCRCAAIQRGASASTCACSRRAIDLDTRQPFRRLARAGLSAAAICAATTRRVLHSAAHARDLAAQARGGGRPRVPAPCEASRSRARARGTARAPSRSASPSPPAPSGR